MEKSSRTTTSYLFDLCLRVIIKMAKTKAKRVPYRDFNPRDRYSIETWRKVKSLFNQGFKRAQIEDQMKIKLHKRNFNQNMKKNYDVPDVNSRKLNRTNKRTDCTVMKDFERESVQLFNTKIVTGPLLISSYHFWQSKSERKKSIRLMRVYTIKLALRVFFERSKLKNSVAD